MTTFDDRKHLLTASFKDKKLEKAYQEYSREYFTGRDRVMFYSAILVYFLYLFLDYFTLVNAKFEIMTIRFVLSLLALGFVGLTYHRLGKQYIQLICLILLLIGGVSIAGMIWLEGSITPPYYIGLIMIAMVMTNLVRISVVLSALALGLLYVAFMLAVKPLPVTTEVITAHFFVSGSFMLTLIGAYVLEVSRRDEFRQYQENRSYSRQLKSMVEEANNSIKRKNAVLNTLTHVFKTPLHQIIGYAQILEQESLGPHEHEEYREFSGNIHVAGKNLLRLVQRLLTYSRLDAGTINMARQRTSTAEIVDCALSRLTEPIEDKNLRIELPESSARLLIDGSLAEQALYEILANAIEVSPQDGRITIALSQDDEAVELTVTDQGRGIDFDRLEEIENTLERTEEFLGIGEKISLGVTLATKILEIHGGTLSYDRSEEGGTIARIAFPLSALAPPPAERSKSDDAPADTPLSKAS